jgi:uncharacterized repeat protein (TIGR01451 family)
MNKKRVANVHKSISVIALLLMLSLNASSMSSSQDGAGNVSGDEDNLQWNMLAGASNGLLELPGYDELLQVYHPPNVIIREPQNGMIFTADETTRTARVAVHVTSSGETVNITIYEHLNPLATIDCPAGETNCPVTYDLEADIGVHTIIAKAVDARGAVCSSLPVTITVNPPEPFVEITKPANGQIITAPATIDIIANIIDSHPITKAEFYANTKKLCELTEAPYQFKWDNASPGVYRLAAKATDDQDNSAISNFVFLVVVPEDPLAKTDLALSMWSSPDPALIGGGINYILTVTNFGPSSATDVFVTDFLPEALVYRYSKANQGSYDNATGEWDVGSLAPYHSARKIHNQATIAGAQYDDDNTNNYAERYTNLIS